MWKSCAHIYLHFCFVDGEKSNGRLEGHWWLVVREALSDAQEGLVQICKLLAATQETSHLGRIPRFGIIVSREADFDTIDL